MEVCGKLSAVFASGRNPQWGLVISRCRAQGMY